MKKQILFMMFLSLAFVFAGLNKSYGQASNPPTGDGDPAAYIENLTAAEVEDIACAPVTTLSCIATADALHPQAGQEYTYTVDVTPDGSHIHWFVTDETDIIVALNDLVAAADPVDGNYVLAAGDSYNVPVDDGTPNTSNTVNITWKSFDPAQTVLLVTYVMGADGCTDNIEVFRIEPVFNFTLDIVALDETGAIDDAATDCFSPVEEAIYDATNEQLDVDYGENWIFFSVTAANFADSWMPEFQVTYPGDFESLEVDWAYPADALANTAWVDLGDGASGDIFSGTTAVDAQAADAVGNDGECIIVRVRVDHGTAENTADLELQLAVNGTMFDPSAESGSEYANSDLDDLGEATETDGPCTQVDFDDYIDYTLTARPDIAEDDPQFEPKNP